jgi:hypothetical protein
MCFEKSPIEYARHLFLLVFSDGLLSFITSTQCMNVHCGRFTPVVIGPFDVIKSLHQNRSQARHKHIAVFTFNIIDKAMTRTHAGMLKLRSVGIWCRAVWYVGPPGLGWTIFLQCQGIRMPLKDWGILFIRNVGTTLTEFVTSHDSLA